MTEPDQTGDRRPAPRGEGMPRWVIGFIIAGVAVAALIALLLALGHGPRQHMSSFPVVPATARV